VARFVLIFMAAMSLSGCSALSALTSMLPGSDGVNANVQAGKENTQAAVSVSERIEAGDHSVVEAVESDIANKITGTQVNNLAELGWNTFLMYIFMGWLIPSPPWGKMWDGLIRLRCSRYQSRTAA
jgi:uncharacterized protein YceK